MKPIELKGGLTSTRWSVKVALGIAVLAFVLTALELKSPTMPPFGGRNAWFSELLFALAGVYGRPLLFFIFGLTCLRTALWFWRHASRVPSDRWW